MGISDRSHRSRLHETTELACESCGVDDNPNKGTFVDERGSEYLQSGEKDTLCHSCFERVVEATTTLAEQEAKVYAYRDSGLTYSEIADQIAGVDQNHVGSVMERVRTKVRVAQATLTIVRPHEV